VVIEVTTDDDWGMGVLLDDISGDVHDPLGTVFQLLLLPWLDVAVEDLDSVLADLQLRPAEVGTHGLHQGEFGIRQGCSPTSTMSLCIGLERPVAIQEERTLQLRLIETDDLRTVLAEDLVHLLLLLFGVDASDIVVHDGELVTVLQHFLRTMVGSPSLFPFTLDISSSSCRAIVISLFAATISILLAVRSMLLWCTIYRPAEVGVTVLF
jgi:hypothetical protein